MSKAGKRLVHAMTDAAAVVRGELSAHSITMQGRTYVPIEEYEEMRRRAELAEGKAPKPTKPPASFYRGV